jgi:hypothetical protein
VNLPHTPLFANTLGAFRGVDGLESLPVNCSEVDDGGGQDEAAEIVECVSVVGVGPHDRESADEVVPRCGSVQPTLDGAPEPRIVQ